MPPGLIENQEDMLVGQWFPQTCRDRLHGVVDEGRDQLLLGSVTDMRSAKRIYDPAPSSRCATSAPMQTIE